MNDKTFAGSIKQPSVIQLEQLHLSFWKQLINNFLIEAGELFGKASALTGCAAHRASRLASATAVLSSRSLPPPHCVRSDSIWPLPPAFPLALPF